MKNRILGMCFILATLGAAGVLLPNTVQAGDSACTSLKGAEKQELMFSNDQKTKVASILSNYEPSSLTVEDAQAINTAFREAGIRRGPGQREAIEAAGFDPEKISRLDPPPEKRRGTHHPNLND